MFIVIKVMLYLVAAHVFYNNGIEPERNIFNFTVLLSVYLLIDMVSHFAGRASLLREIITEQEE